jgi:hypothetical protein
VPTINGGDPPPVMEMAAHGRGRRRLYGVRALER